MGIQLQKKHEEFSDLFKQLDGQKKRELIAIMGTIASHSKRGDSETWKAYADRSMQKFSLTGKETDKDFSPIAEQAQLYPKALSYFALMEDKYQEIIVNGLKGMVENGIC